jgi:EF hand
MKWARTQGAVTGYAHSANGLVINDPAGRAKALLAQLDKNMDGFVSKDEAKGALLPEDFATIDADGDGMLTLKELTTSIVRCRDRLPNLVVPPMDGIGAQEICVTTALGLCDFISAMDTQRIPEWNCWYHLMNCGFPLKASGETDFPCISGSRVGQGRVYVQLGKVEKVDFGEWCDGIRKGRSYISDGYAHALEFTVEGKSAGQNIDLEKPGKVKVKAKVAFASELPLGTAVGGPLPKDKTRKVELIVNGVAVASKEVPADDKTHDLSFDVDVDRSSWIAVRQFPQLHTNPVTVLIGGKPIRASRQSAEWCAETIEQLWKVRGPGIAKDERAEAEKTFQKAIEVYRSMSRE